MLNKGHSSSSSWRVVLLVTKLLIGSVDPVDNQLLTVTGSGPVDLQHKAMFVHNLLQEALAVFVVVALAMPAHDLVSM